MIEALPRRARVFDAFTGCFAISKLLQRWGHDLRIVANDCGYRNRLDAVKDTNRVITEMLAAGAHNGIRHHYERYAPDVERRLVDICATGIDQISCRINLYCGNGATIRLDPPYRRSPKAWGQGEYIGEDACRDARDFCAAAIANARGSVWLWDEPDSDLVRMAQARGAHVRPFPGIRNRQEVREVMCEIRRIPNTYAGFPLFAWAAKKGLAI